MARQRTRRAASKKVLRQVQALKLRDVYSRQFAQDMRNAQRRSEAKYEQHRRAR